MSLESVATNVLEIPAVGNVALLTKVSSDSIILLLDFINSILTDDKLSSESVGLLVADTRILDVEETTSFSSVEDEVAVITTSEFVEVVSSSSTIVTVAFREIVDTDVTASLDSITVELDVITRIELEETTSDPSVIAT